MWRTNRNIICNPAFNAIFESDDFFNIIDSLFNGSLFNAETRKNDNKSIDSSKKHKDDDNSNDTISLGSGTGIGLSKEPNDKCYTITDGYPWIDQNVDYISSSKPQVSVTHPNESKETKKKSSPKSILDIIGIPNHPIKDDKVETTTQRKSPFVFVSNRLTFLIQTKHPIIFETSKIVTPTKDCIFVAFDEKKTFPKIDLIGAVKIAHEINCDESIKKEIYDYLDGTEWGDIYCVPHTMKVNGVNRLGFMFAITNDRLQR